MKNIYKLSLFILSLNCTLLNAQLVESPLYSNPFLFSQNKSDNFNEKAVNNIDSTFIYRLDTISIPILDEFTKNRFQVFDADYSDPGVTNEVFYQLKDPGTDLPLDTSKKYTSIQTFKRTVDLANATYVDSPLPGVSIKVGDFAVYPVVYTTVTAYPPYFIYDTIDFPNPVDTVYLSMPEYFQDSARVFSAPINDPNLIWADNDVFHNYTFPLNPITLGVATFDGLNSKGKPYQPNSTASGIADHLTSKPIFMGAYNPADSIYLSFLVQRGGLGETPEPNDSLILEFYAPVLMEWTQVYGFKGGTPSDFKVGHISIVDTKYLQDGFKFRFKNYGSLSGALDHFHLDYVQLRNNSGYQDTFFKDFAFSYPLNTLLKDYTQVPWDHFKASPVGRTSDAVEVVVHNNSNLTENNQNGQTNISYQGMPEGSVTLIAQTLSGGAINYAPTTTYYSYHDFTAFNFDATKPGTKAIFDVVSTAAAPFPNLAINDTTSFKQYFLNYYAHDDGSAERAIGPSGTQSMFAIQYEAYIPDSIIAIDIHFVQSAFDLSNKLFILSIWDDAGNEPGNLIYEDNNFLPRQPSYLPDQGVFRRYFLQNSAKASVPTKFYVGYRQIDGTALNVGHDKNTDTKEKTFYSTNNGVDWSTSPIPGSVMIRPVFSTAMDAELGVVTIPEIQPEISIYPNPAENILHIKYNNFEYAGMELYNLQGQMLEKTESSSMDVSNIPAGVYIIRLPNYPNKTFKIIKK